MSSLDFSALTDAVRAQVIRHAFELRKSLHCLRSVYSWVVWVPKPSYFGLVLFPPLLLYIYIYIYPPPPWDWEWISVNWMVSACYALPQDDFWLPSFMTHHQIHWDSIIDKSFFFQILLLFSFLLLYIFLFFFCLSSSVFPSVWCETTWPNLWFYFVSVFRNVNYS